MTREIRPEDLSAARRVDSHILAITAGLQALEPHHQLVSWLLAAPSALFDQTLDSVSQMLMQQDASFSSPEFLRELLKALYNEHQGSPAGQPTVGPMAQPAVAQPGVAQPAVAQPGESSTTAVPEEATQVGQAEQTGVPTKVAPGQVATTSNEASKAKDKKNKGKEVPAVAKGGDQQRQRDELHLQLDELDKRTGGPEQSAALVREILPEFLKQAQKHQDAAAYEAVASEVRDNLIGAVINNPKFKRTELRAIASMLHAASKEQTGREEREQAQEEPQKATAAALQQVSEDARRVYLTFRTHRPADLASVTVMVGDEQEAVKVMRELSSIGLMKFLGNRVWEGVDLDAGR